MAVAVAAMIADDAKSELALPGPHATDTAQVMAQQSRMFIHEIRNALLPVQTALEQIDRLVRSAGLEESARRERERVDEGIERVLHFASALQDSVRLVGEAPDAFDASSAIRDATGAIQSELGVAPRLHLAGSLPALFGHRQRFLLALVNVLRNAIQAASNRAGFQPTPGEPHETFGTHLDRR